MTSRGEELSLSQFWNDLTTQDTDQRVWLKGARISQDDIKRGGPHGKESGQCTVERLTAKDWWAETSRRDYSAHRGVDTARLSASAGRGVAGKAATKGPLRMTFGKAKGSLAVDVRENDPRYWTWLIENVSWFAAKAREAGLLDGEDSAA